MKFVQVIEVGTSQIDELLELDRTWRQATAGKRTATRSMITKDRDRPDTYLIIVEFPSYEEAMRNNDLPETGQIAEGLTKLAKRPAEFRNLDVVDDKAL